MQPATTSTEFVIPLENQVGTLAEIAGVLAKENVNITGLLCEGGNEFGTMRLVTDDPTTTARVLRAAHRTFRANDVIALRVPNEPGRLLDVAQRLAASGVNVNAAYVTAAPDGTALLTFNVDDLRSAQKILHS